MKCLNFIKVLMETSRVKPRKWRIFSINSIRLSKLEPIERKFMDTGVIKKLH